MKTTPLLFFILTVLFQAVVAASLEPGFLREADFPSAATSSSSLAISLVVASVVAVLAVAAVLLRRRASAASHRELETPPLPTITTPKDQRVLRW
ncbi:hypothetical protein Ae201684P_002895 [Aphanomyces euteiches]|uniref:Uncharacterized protein n=1 Tax=Aphanomyces euteiches TaxID=100861 RepID=A0A6G0X2I0_9STRA|nr:hypothetical protein Ae201684_009192 [Aphanomyces euteiches]KAH9070538.1 hypothetical protein Ae201684P_002895 [Aphanomyces euteiches]KAH9134087.1 hypothetical protein AeRB84_020053 [Aphanomyces euteiches]